MPHIHYSHDFVITALLVNDKGQVLLVKHPRYGRWIPVGGHIETNEDPEQALYREIEEETGLSVEPLPNKQPVESGGTKFLPTPDYMDVHEANPPHKHISCTYFVQAKSTEFTLSDEHEEMRWFSEADLEDPEYDLSPAVKFYAREALKKFGF